VSLTDPVQAHLQGTDILLDGTVYLIGSDGTREAYPSLAIYNSWHIANDFDTVVAANAADMALPVSGLVQLRVKQ